VRRFNQRTIPPYRLWLRWRWNGLVEALHAVLSAVLGRHVCSRCFTIRGVRMESARTMYHWEGIGANPNADIPYCRRCAVDHHEYWDAEWEEYNASR